MTQTMDSNEGDFSSISSVGSVEHFREESVTPADTEFISQKRRSGRKSSGSAKKARTAGLDVGDSSGQTTTLGSPRYTRRTTTRSVPRPGNEPTGGRAPSRRVPEIWSPEYLLANPKSKLARCNLNDLINQRQWDLLSYEEQAECLSHLPPSDILHIEGGDGSTGNLAVNLVDGFFERNLTLQDDFRTFQDDLSEGRFLPSFIERAANARKRRLQGEFDKWKDNQYELWWGQNQKLATGMLAGDTTRLKLADMARGRMLFEGDVWLYCRTFKGCLTIKKEILCTQIDGQTFSLSFRCPPKSEEYLRAGLEPLILEGIENPTTLETELLDEDGRIPKYQRPNGNAFKCIRIIRKNEDIGTLFDVRMSAFEKLQGKDDAASRQVHGGNRAL